jgi:hypothetical protein
VIERRADHVIGKYLVDGFDEFAEIFLPVSLDVPIAPPAAVIPRLRYQFIGQVSG